MIKAMTVALPAGAPTTTMRSLPMTTRRPTAKPPPTIQ